MRALLLLGALAVAVAGGRDDRVDRSRFPDPGPQRPNPDVAVGDCELIEQDARALVASVQGCTGSCQLVSFAQLLGGQSCVGAFQCSVALPADLDRDAFRTAALALDAEKEACGECAMAACRSPEELDAECVDGQCEVVPRSPPPQRPNPILR